MGATKVAIAGAARAADRDGVSVAPMDGDKRGEVTPVSGNTPTSPRTPLIPAEAEAARKACE